MEPPRGPIESRDEFLLAHSRLTLPAVSPDPVGRGHTVVRLSSDWGNDFGVDLQPGQPEILYLVDGEHTTLAVEVRRGLTSRLSLQARLPLRWRGGGVLDNLIDGWHRLTGLPDSGRPFHPRHRLRVQGLDKRGRPIVWEGGPGAGLGNLELGASLALASRPHGWRSALVARVDVPTGSGAFAGGGSHGGAQLVAAHSLGPAADVYLMAGATVASGTRDEGLEYSRTRTHSSMVLEWRPGPRVSLLAETAAASGLVRNLEGFPAFQLYLRLGTKIDVGQGWRLEGGFTEGLTRITNTTDFGVMVGLERSF